MAPVTYLLKTIVVGPLETNCYLLCDAKSMQTLIIDPGAAPARIVEAIRRNHMLPSGIINTHGHWDHIGANEEIKKKYDIPLYISRSDAAYLAEPQLNGSILLGAECLSPEADILLDDTSIIRNGALELRVIATPGHTPGGICLQVEDLLFTGDTLFCGAVGRTDLPGGSTPAMLQSLKKFSAFSPRLRILPGHGNACDLGKEFEHNPYLNNPSHTLDGLD